jgi:UDP-N-acetylglucosamine transferase subunit ALG13
MHNLTAVAYYGGIPPNNKNAEKPLILDNFLSGVHAVGDNAIAHRGMNSITCDVALIQGFVHEHGKSSPHLQLRQDAVALQKKNGKRSLIVDSNLFLYADPSNSKHYLRYSFDGVFPTTGFYFDRDIDPSRWNKISQQLNIQLKPYRTAGSHILICLQRHGGWSMRGLSTVDWVNQTITKIRQYSSRPIIVRTHPGDKKIKSILKINHKDIIVSNKERLIDDLQNAWATVVYNSSPSVASLVEGIPTFLTDPQPEHSQTFGIANTDLSKIENPIMSDRQSWIERLAMCHWNFEELRSGEAWQFFRQYV